VTSTNTHFFVSTKISPLRIRVRNSIDYTQILVPIGDRMLIYDYCVFELVFV